MFGVLGREGVDVHDGVKVGGPNQENADLGTGMTVAVVVSVPIVVAVSVALPSGAKGGRGGGGRGCL